MHVSIRDCGDHQIEFPVGIAAVDSSLPNPRLGGNALDGKIRKTLLHQETNSRVKNHAISLRAPRPTACLLDFVHVSQSNHFPQRRTHSMCSLEAQLMELAQASSATRLRRQRSPHPLLSTPLFPGHQRRRPRRINQRSAGIERQRGANCHGSANRVSRCLRCGGG